ncbi:hypothetical protein [Nocardia sp. NPDC052566]|uniref:hypothetical protein n=1 Tax=Nocardia sp. NPDC052566 TaxID=3364330 RepID=UPI0037C60F60
MTRTSRNHTHTELSLETTAQLLDRIQDIGATKTTIIAELAHSLPPDERARLAGQLARIATQFSLPPAHDHTPSRQPPPTPESVPTSHELLAAVNGFNLHRPCAALVFELAVLHRLDDLSERIRWRRSELIDTLNRQLSPRLTTPPYGHAHGVSLGEVVDELVAAHVRADQLLRTDPPRSVQACDDDALHHAWRSVADIADTWTALTTGISTDHHHTRRAKRS